MEYDSQFSHIYFFLHLCIIGDFNDMLTADEKKGGKNHPRCLLNGFSEVISDCNLIDLGYIGDKFTWERARGTDKWVLERLDRGLATKEWREFFHQRRFEFMKFRHRAICLCVYS